MNTDTLLKAITSTVALSPHVAEAFRQVDRANFVPEYYRHQGAEWILEPAGAAAYEDKALTTQVRNGLASSSSSQPSVMALMLEALDVQPGQRVLEIGTGTGYNAALLAFLVGEHGQVVTVDIDEELIRRARERLGKAGYTGRVTTRLFDGREGYAEAAPFDRIILTAGFRHLSTAWIEQLRPGGILVGNLRGNIVSVLLQLQKEDAQQGSGHLLSRNASFMELHGPAYPALSAPDWQQYDTAPSQHRETNDDILQALANPAFLFFLEGQLPQMQLHLRAFGTPEQSEICNVFLLNGSTATLHHNGTIETRGSAWECIEDIYQHYQQLGAPALDAYRLISTSSPWNPCLYVQIQEESWRLC